MAIFAPGSWASPESAEAQESLYRVEGTVTTPDGEPVSGITVRAFGESGVPGHGPWNSSTGSNGAYAVEVPDGRYVLGFLVTLAEGECQLGYTGAGGGHTLSAPSSNKRILIAGGDATGVDVTLPAEVSELCRPITGLVSDSDGNPLEVWIAADGLGAILGLRVGATKPTDPTFTMYGPAGSYKLLVATTAGSACTVARHPASGRGRRATIVVGSEGVAGIRAVISGDPSDTLQVLDCSFPPERIATELQPGWNLGSWTGEEEPVKALFEEIPELQIAHSWDAAEQRFRSAIAGEGEGLGDLTTLQPGMGLWLYVGGIEPVQWTRVFLPESGLVRLSEGWNLLAWSGKDGASAGDAFENLGSDFAGAATWDTGEARFLEYAPDAPAGTAELEHIRRGEGLWVRAWTDRYWLQPASAGLPVEFGGGYSDERQAELLELVDTAVTYFAHRFGVFVPGTAVHYRSAEAQGCFYSAGTVALREACYTAIGHEYSHAIQEYLAPSVDRGPAWLIEGVANRWSAQFHEARGFRTYDDHLRETTLPLARRTPLPLEALEDGLFVDGFTVANYNIVHVAIDWLVELNGEDRTFRYHQERASHESWQEAFQAVFGLSIDEFYADFADYRAEFFPPEPRLHGSVVGPDGQPLANVRIFGDPFEANGARWSAITAQDGTFQAFVSNGQYLISATDFSLAEDCHFGWYEGDDSLASSRHQALVVTVDGADVGNILIRLAADPSALASELCSRVEGVVLGPEGEPVPGLHALLLRQDRLTEGDPTDLDGRFSIVAPPGIYNLSLWQGTCHIGWYGGGDGLATPGQERLVNVESGKDITDIEIRLPAPVSDLCR